MKNRNSVIIVNSITMTRVIGTFILPFISKNISPSSLIIYIGLLLLTDAIDGMLARRLKASTVFGSMLDATADKFLGIACLIVLSRKFPVMIFPIITEIIITIINTRGAIGGSTTESSTLGKVKTWVLGLSIVFAFGTVYSTEIINGLNNAGMGKHLISVMEYIKDNSSGVISMIGSLSVGAGIIVSADYQIKVKKEIALAAEEGFALKKFKLKTGEELKYALFNEEYYQETRNLPIAKKLGVIKDEKVNRR